MNLQVFLEWFHRLDAFVVGVALLVMAVAATVLRRRVPRWFPWVSVLLVLMVALQGGLGALTVLQLLPSQVVTAHLALALTLVALLSAVTQRLLDPAVGSPPFWWRPLSGLALLAVIGMLLRGRRSAAAL